MFGTSGVDNPDEFSVSGHAIANRRSRSQPRIGSGRERRLRAWHGWQNSPGGARLRRWPWWESGECGRLRRVDRVATRSRGAPLRVPQVWCWQATRPTHTRGSAWVVRGNIRSVRRCHSARRGHTGSGIQSARVKPGLTVEPAAGGRHHATGLLNSRPVHAQTRCRVARAARRVRVRSSSAWQHGRASQPLAVRCLFRVFRFVHSVAANGSGAQHHPDSGANGPDPPPRSLRHDRSSPPERHGCRVASCRPA